MTCAALSWAHCDGCFWQGCCQACASNTRGLPNRLPGVALPASMVSLEAGCNTTMFTSCSVSVFLSCVQEGALPVGVRNLSVTRTLLLHAAVAYSHFRHDDDLVLPPCIGSHAFLCISAAMPEPNTGPCCCVLLQGRTLGAWPLRLAGSLALCRSRRDGVTPVPSRAMAQSPVGVRFVDFESSRALHFPAFDHRDTWNVVCSSLCCRSRQWMGHQS